MVLPMEIERLHSDALVVNPLPDGSKILVDQAKQTVFALNPMAAAVWDACGASTSLSDVAANMNVSEDVAANALFDLQAQNLIAVTGLSFRRAAAAPFVVALTMTEQMAFAEKSGSCGDPGLCNGSCIRRIA
jgi:hypothetical protein